MDTNPLYLAKLDRSAFVVDEGFDTETAKINGNSYPNSMIASGANDATSTIEFNIPKGYKSFEFTLGLTDDTRKDRDFDGTVSTIVFVGGNQVFGPQQSTYPDETPVTVPVNGATRIRVDVSGVDGAEFPCLCGAKFVK